MSTTEQLNGLPPEVSELIERLRGSYRNAYRLRWKGSKVPRGARVGLIRIGWTQHGVVYGEDGRILGYYTRTEEFGGEGRDEHEMIITCDEALAGGEGHAVEQLHDFNLEERHTG